MRNHETWNRSTDTTEILLRSNPREIIFPTLYIKTDEGRPDMEKVKTLESLLSYFESQHMAIPN